MAGRGRRHTEDVARLRSARRPECWICGQRIDYALAWPDPGSFSLDHRLPRSTHPHLEHDPANHEAAHLGCNSSRQAKAPSPGLGTLSRRW